MLIKVVTICLRIKSQFLIPFFFLLSMTINEEIDRNEFKFSRKQWILSFVSYLNWFPFIWFGFQTKIDWITLLNKREEPNLCNKQLKSEICPKKNPKKKLNSHIFRWNICQSYQQCFPQFSSILFNFNTSIFCFVFQFNRIQKFATQEKLSHGLNLFRKMKHVCSWFEHTRMYTVYFLFRIYW